MAAGLVPSTDASMGCVVAMIAARIRLTCEVRRPIRRVITAQYIRRIVHAVAIAGSCEQMTKTSRAKGILLAALAPCQSRRPGAIPAGIVLKRPVVMREAETSGAGDSLVGFTSVLIEPIEFDRIDVTRLSRRGHRRNLCDPVASVPGVGDCMANRQCNDVNGHSNVDVHPAAPVIPDSLPAENLGISRWQVLPDRHAIQPNN